MRKCQEADSSPISIHPPLAGRDGFSVVGFSVVGISIHPPLAGRDLVAQVCEHGHVISIHPPLAGRDSAIGALSNTIGDFNPPAPCGAGRRRKYVRVTLPLFQSTRPLRGGTLQQLASALKDLISIHPPLAGRDQCGRILRHKTPYFNPPAPCGAGQCKSPRSGRGWNFNPPAPCGAGPAADSRSRQGPNFNPPAPCGAGRGVIIDHSCHLNFNPPAPCGAGRFLGETRAQTWRFQSTRPLRGGTW